MHGKCEIVKCAQSRNVDFCFTCPEFPCKLFEEGFDLNFDEIPEYETIKLGTVKWKPYSEEFIHYIKTFKSEREN